MDSFKVAQVDTEMMAEQVGPRGSKPECFLVLRGLKGDEGFPGEFHQGQQTTGLHHRPDIRLQPDLKRQHQVLLAKREASI